MLENSSREDKHECPFARSSIQLTVLLCELLRIGEPCEWTGHSVSRNGGRKGREGQGLHTLSP